jgi:predicted RNase H-like HicB family nuclease
MVHLKVPHRVTEIDDQVDELRRRDERLEAPYVPHSIGDYTLERHLETQDGIEHPEASEPAEGATMRGYVVIFEGDDESGYSAYSPDLPGVIAAGETRSEAERLMVEAMAAHIAMLRQAGQPVPEPSEAANVVIVDPAAA